MDSIPIKKKFMICEKTKNMITAGDKKSKKSIRYYCENTFRGVSV